MERNATMAEEWSQGSFKKNLLHGWQEGSNYGMWRDEMSEGVTALEKKIFSIMWHVIGHDRNEKRVPCR